MVSLNVNWSDPKVRYSLEAALLFLALSNPITTEFLSGLLPGKPWILSLLLTAAYGAIVYFRMRQSQPQ